MCFMNGVFVFGLGSSASAFIIERPQNSRRLQALKPQSPKDIPFVLFESDLQGCVYISEVLEYWCRYLSTLVVFGFSRLSLRSRAFASFQAAASLWLRTQNQALQGHGKMNCSNVADMTPKPVLAASAYYRGLNNYLYYFGGFLIMIIVYWAPKPYSNY